MTPQELSCLDYEGASEMLLAYATDAKKYEKEIASLKAQSDDWKAKAALAQAKNMTELAQAALQRAAELDAKAQQLSLELADIRRDIEDLRQALPILKAKQRRIDPDQLLAELSMIVGFEDELSGAGPTSGCAAGVSRQVTPVGAPAEGGSTPSGAPSESGPGSTTNATSSAPITPAETTPSAAPPQSDSIPTPSPTSSSVPSPGVDDALAELKRKMGLL